MIDGKFSYTRHNEMNEKLVKKKMKILKFSECQKLLNLHDERHRHIFVFRDKKLHVFDILRRFCPQQLKVYRNYHLLTMDLSADN
jgi:hypothetical protein